ncbi:hypothetical protein GCM10011351_17440 [Paraliobacillus quinghaiensis]|uniref:RNA polymerase sigma-70 region 2 domain-containing protein n=1 Tax=Paraliobacillus quinghaiensis TaxID=470815 RepID=A0A917WV68_9BACI|nr:sigma-70 family RNA polymerase sigma factor [Paraliobacillus quinghaiensis]GGM31740.1 hypothetical protein GCM10011351_17440 [Paraliobacillus quinghaiensis]
MNEEKMLDFENVLNDHENIIYHLINKYRIRDSDQEFYQEGTITLWKAMETYDEKRGKFSSYAYFLIDKAFLSMIRSRVRKAELQESYIAGIASETDQLTATLEIDFDPYLLESIEKQLSANQMKWFTLAVLYDKTYKEIATQENVTVDAVKNWARLAKPKIKKILANEC